MEQRLSQYTSKIAKRYWKQIFGMILLAILVAVAFPISTVLLNALVEQIGHDESIAIILLLFSTHCLFRGIGMGGASLNTWFQSRLIVSIAKDLKESLLKHIFETEVFELRSKDTGEWLSVFSLCDKYAELAVKPFFSTIGIFCSGFTTIVILARTSASVLLAVLIPLILYFLANYFFSKNLKERFAEKQETRRNFWSFVSEVFDGRDDIRGNGYDKLVSRLHLQRNCARVEAEIRAGTINVYRSAAGELILQMSLILSIIWIAKLQSNAGAIISVYYLIQNLFEESKNLGDLYQQYQQRVVCGLELDRVFGLRRRNIGELPDVLKQPLYLVENLTYSIKDTNIFCGETFSIKKGELVLIMGESGTGKSTLLELLLTIRHPSAGKIYFCGKDVEEIGLDTLSTQIAYMPQRCNIFEGSVEENITLEHSPVRENEFLKSMQLDLKQEVFTQNRGLSGGQIQRICLLRTLARKCPILFLDEPTSSMDQELSKKVYEEIVRIHQEERKTIVVVDHKNMLMEKADVVLYYQAGRLYKTRKNNGYESSLKEALFQE